MAKIEWTEKFEQKLLEKLRTEYNMSNNLIDFASRSKRPSNGGLIKVEGSARSMVDWIKKELGV